MSRIINDSESSGSTGGGFDVVKWVQGVFDAIRGSSATPRVKERLMRFAQGRAVRNFTVADPYRVSAANVRLKIPGLRIDPQIVSIQPRVDGSPIVPMRREERKRRWLTENDELNE